VERTFNLSGGFQSGVATQESGSQRPSEMILKHLRNGSYMDRWFQALVAR